MSTAIGTLRPRSGCLLEALRATWLTGPPTTAERFPARDIIGYGCHLRQDLSLDLWELGSIWNQIIDGGRYVIMLCPNWWFPRGYMRQQRF